MSFKISVITVCYNAVDVIERTILSVINQTYCNIEYIIVDGNSTDGTMDIINKYRDRISIVVSEPDNGVYDAMNKGIGLATGEWLNFMNAGDSFSNESIIEDVFKSDIPDTTKFIYSDYFVKIEGGLSKRGCCSIEKGIINHQSSIYKKELHTYAGLYLVTKPYIISDLLFFYSVPRDYYYKTPIVISTYMGGGISAQGLWCKTQSIYAKGIFYNYSPFEVFKQLLICYAIDMIPKPLRDVVRKIRWSSH